MWKRYIWRDPLIVQEVAKEKTTGPIINHYLIFTWYSFFSNIKPVIVVSNSVKKKKKQTKIIYGARWHDYARHIDLAVEKRVGRREANGMRPILDCWIENTHYCTRTEGKFTSNLTTPVARLDLKKNECGRLVCSLIVRIYRFMTNKIFNRSHGF